MHVRARRLGERGPGENLHDDTCALGSRGHHQMLAGLTADPWPFVSRRSDDRADERTRFEAASPRTCSHFGGYAPRCWLTTPFGACFEQFQKSFGYSFRQAPILSHPPGRMVVMERRRLWCTTSEAPASAAGSSRASVPNGGIDVRTRAEVSSQQPLAPLTSRNTYVHVVLMSPLGASKSVFEKSFEYFGVSFCRAENCLTPSS